MLLKLCRSIREAKWHYSALKMTVSGPEGSLPFICLFYRDLVVARLLINITEVFGPHELIKEVVDLGNRVSVSDCDFIQSPVINAKPPGYICLLDQHDWDPAR